MLRDSPVCAICGSMPLSDSNHCTKPCSICVRFTRPFDQFQGCLFVNHNSPARSLRFHGEYCRRKPFRSLYLRLFSKLTSNKFNLNKYKGWIDIVRIVSAVIHAVVRNYPSFANTIPVLLYLSVKPRNPTVELSKPCSDLLKVWSPLYSDHHHLPNIVCFAVQ